MIPNYYQPYYPQQYQQPIIQQPVQQPIPQTPPSQPLAWIKDEQEAIDYPLSSGQSIFLITQDESYLYGKSCDQLGKVTFIKKRLVDETAHNENDKVNVKDFVLREELEDLIMDRIQSEIEKKISEISFKPTKARKQVIIDEE